MRLLLDPPSAAAAAASKGGGEGAAAAVVVGLTFASGGRVRVSLVGGRGGGKALLRDRLAAALPGTAVVADGKGGGAAGDSNGDAAWVRASDLAKVLPALASL